MCFYTHKYYINSKCGLTVKSLCYKTLAFRVDGPTPDMLQGFRKDKWMAFF